MSTYGDLLRAWRTARGVSQVNLSLLTGVSQRHISFLETGRARPGRRVLVGLADALDVPAFERNRMLKAARCTPDPTFETEPSMLHDEARRALRRLMTAHDPIPAVTVDKPWTLLDYNKGFSRLVALFGDLEAIEGRLSSPLNFLELFYSTAGVCSFVTNGSFLGRQTFARLQREALAEPDNDAPRALLERLEAISGAPPHWQQLEADPLSPVAELAMEKGSVKLRCSLVISSFGTPFDAGFDEWRVITFLPLDARSRQHFGIVDGDG